MKACFALVCFVCGAWMRGGSADTAATFVYHTSPLNWNEANAQCLQNGTTLASLDGTSHAAATDFFESVLDDLTDDVWIGVYDLSAASTGYSWAATCEALDGQWTNWDSGEPSNTDAYFCVGLVRGEYSWKTFPCHEQKPFLCFRPGGQCVHGECSFSTDYTPHTSSGSHDLYPKCTLTTTEASPTTSLLSTSQGETKVQSTTQGETTEESTTQGETTEESTTQGETTEESTTQGETAEESTTQGETAEESTTQGETTTHPTTHGDTTTQKTTEGEETAQTTTEGGVTTGTTARGHATTSRSSQGDTTTPTTTEVEATTRTVTDAEQTTEISTGGDATAQTTTNAEATTRPAASTVVVGSSTSTTVGTTKHDCCVCQRPSRLNTSSHLTENLLLDKSKLSSTRRRKGSATDNRMSCAAIGIASVLLVFSVYAFVVLTDIFRICRHLRFGVFYGRKRKD